SLPISSSRSVTRSVMARSQDQVGSLASQRDRRTLCLGIAALAALAACKHAPDEDDDEQPAAAAVTCAPVVAASIDDTVEVSGVSAPPPKVAALVGSPVAGRIAQITVEAGDRVAAGAVMAVIEDPSLPAGSLEAKAGVASAQAATAAANQELARQQR